MKKIATIMNKTFLSVLAVLAIASAQQASALTLVDRGLPTANLNNEAGSDRSNVAWAFTTYTSDDYWVVGDTFANTSSQTWLIDSIRLWTVGRTDTAILRGGYDGSSTVGVISSATYVSPGPNDLYQGSGGSYISMSQVDFDVNLLLAPGQIYNFFLDGSGNENDIYVPFVHASNAALSGSPQQGADDLMLYANVINGVLDSSTIGTWSSQGFGWDKASDVNVQVFGHAVPDAGTTLTLLGYAVVGLGLLRRKFNA